MKVLNLYAGIGGNRKLWTDVEVTAIELENKIADVYKANFPDDNVIIADAHQYLLDHYTEFDFIWSSPPCQSHSRMMKATKYDIRKYPDMSLYQEIIWLSNFFKGKWIVENVKPYYAALIKPSQTLGRHYIWSNFIISFLQVKNFNNFIQADSKKEMDAMKKQLGINYEGNIYYGKNHSPGQVLRNCINPELGLHILNCALQKESVVQKTIFD